MADSDLNMERFAHDVCVHVLEKFDIFKAPDDTRRQNKYLSHDFLPSVSRLVVSYAIWMRDSFKSDLENKYRTADLNDKEIVWKLFDDCFEFATFKKMEDCTRKLCASLSLCTEYIQFLSTKDLAVSLNKLVIRWNDFFEKNLRKNFESKGGFLKLYSDLKTFQAHPTDCLHKEFISNFFLPYGAKECTMELVKKYATALGVPVNVAIFGVELTDVDECSSVKIPEEQKETRYSEASQSNPSGSDEPKLEGTKSETSDSKHSSSSTDTTEGTDSEMSRKEGSEADDSEPSRNNLLGIPPHEEMLREIDPFFVDNIPLPPKPRSASKSPDDQPGSSEDVPRSSEQVELEEMVEKILSGVEQQMEELRSLLFDHGLLSKKSGRRGSRMRVKGSKDKIPPQGPEGLI